MSAYAERQVWALVVVSCHPKGFEHRVAHVSSKSHVSVMDDILGGFRVGFEKARGRDLKVRCPFCGEKLS